MRRHPVSVAVLVLTFCSFIIPSCPFSFVLLKANANFKHRYTGIIQMKNKEMLRNLGHCQHWPWLVLTLHTSRGKTVSWKTKPPVLNQCESGADGLAPASTATSFQMVSFSSGYISIFTIRQEYLDFWLCATEVFTWHLILIVHISEARAPVFVFFYDIMSQPIADAVLPLPHLSIISASHQMHLQKLHVAAWLNLSASRSRADALSDILINQLQQAAASFSSPTPLLCF